MGEDQAAGFASWHAWQEIASLAVLCVAGAAPAQELPLRAPGVRVETLRLPAMPEAPPKSVPG